MAGFCGGWFLVGVPYLKTLKDSQDGLKLSGPLPSKVLGGIFFLLLFFFWFFSFFCRFFFLLFSCFGSFFSLIFSLFLSDLFFPFQSFPLSFPFSVDLEVGVVRGIDQVLSSICVRFHRRV